MNTPGQRLRHLRLKRNLSTRAAASGAGISESTIRDIESDRRGSTHVIALCWLYKANPFWVQFGRGKEDWISQSVGEYVVADSPDELVEELEGKPAAEVARIFATLYERAKK